MALAEDFESPPQANPEFLQLLSSVTGWRLWSFKSADPLEFIMEPGYFNTASQHGMQVGDEIIVVACHGRPESEGGCEHAVLAVTHDEFRFDPPRDEADVDRSLHIQVKRIR